MSRRLVIILVIGAIAVIWGWLEGPAARQERGMKAAHALQLQLQPRLDADPRFSAVSLGVSTHPALQDLRSIVVLPPDANYGLIFSVKVDAEAAARPAR